MLCVTAGSGRSDDHIWHSGVWLLFVAGHRGVVFVGRAALRVATVLCRGDCTLGDFHACAYYILSSSSAS